MQDRKQGLRPLNGGPARAAVFLNTQAVGFDVALNRKARNPVDAVAEACAVPIVAKKDGGVNARVVRADGFVVGEVYVVGNLQGAGDVKLLVRACGADAHVVRGNGGEPHRGAVVGPAGVSDNPAAVGAV